MEMIGLQTLALAAGLLSMAAISVAVQRQESRPDGAQYRNGTSLVRPLNYREWAFVGAGLGLTYDGEATVAAGPPKFTSVFVNPSSYRDFIRTGKWSDGTVFVLEIRRSETNASPNQGGRFQGELLSLEAEVKDSRFPDGWAFFTFGSNPGLADVAPALSGDKVTGCVECHTKHTAVERTFVQFYPTLLDVARQRGTVKPGF
jgi:hypothetical protein